MDTAEPVNMNWVDDMRMKTRTNDVRFVVCSILYFPLAKLFFYLLKIHIPTTAVRESCNICHFSDWRVETTHVAQNARH
jgi:hypothetical protein